MNNRVTLYIKPDLYAKLLDRRDAILRKHGVRVSISRIILSDIEGLYGEDNNKSE